MGSDMTPPLDLKFNFIGAVDSGDDEAQAIKNLQDFFDLLGASILQCVNTGGGSKLSLTVNGRQVTVDVYQTPELLAQMNRMYAEGALATAVPKGNA